MRVPKALERFWETGMVSGRAVRASHGTGKTRISPQCPWIRREPGRDLLKAAERFLKHRSER